MVSAELELEKVNHTDPIYQFHTTVSDQSLHILKEIALSSTVQKFVVRMKIIILLLSKEALNWSNVTVEIFIMLQMFYSNNNLNY